MSTFMKVWKNRAVLLELLKILQKLAKGAKSLQELRNRIAQGAQRGDLDDVLKRFASANERAQDFVNQG